MGGHAVHQLDSDVALMSYNIARHCKVSGYTALPSVHKFMYSPLKQLESGHVRKVRKILCESTKFSWKM